MEPEKIKTLLAVPEEQLDQAARKLHLPLPIAHSIRLQAMNLVLGKCCLCGRQTQLGVCKSCSKNPVTGRVVPWSGQELLLQLDPSDQLISRTCTACKRTFTLSAKYLLQQLQANDYRPKKLCRFCSERAGAGEERAPETKIEAQSEAQTSDMSEEEQRLERVARIEREKARVEAQKLRRKKKPAPKEPQPRNWTDNGSVRLNQNPFAESEAMKKLNEGLKQAPLEEAHGDEAIQRVEKA